MVHKKLSKKPEDGDMALFPGQQPFIAGLAGGDLWGMVSMVLMLSTDQEMQHAARPTFFIVKPTVLMFWENP